MIWIKGELFSSFPSTAYCVGQFGEIREISKWPEPFSDYTQQLVFVY